MYEKILDISKRRGIIYPSFEIYGGLSGFYDYGPIGSRIKNNIENLIRDYYLIDESCIEVQCPTLSPEEVWIASGHVQNFTDIITECTKCGEPYRADHLIEEKTKETINLNLSEIQEILDKKNVRCPKCGSKLDKAYNYNLMFQTFVGPGKSKTLSYLRPETAQTTYLAFRRLWEISRKKLPFGVLQIGHSYRNEISPRQGMIRLREFNQAEIQFFLDPNKKETERFNEVSDMELPIQPKDKDKPIKITLKEAVDKGIIKIQLIAYLLGKSFCLFKDMGIDPNLLKLRQHLDTERSFYSSDTWDIEFMSKDFGRVELVGIADRSDYDLSAHMKLSKQDFQINVDNRKFVPHIVEVAYGIDRPLYCVLESCYREEDNRSYFKFPIEIAPYIVGVFPLVQKDGLPEKASSVLDKLKKDKMYAIYDEAGSIGKRYARADEIGIPYCITIDYQTLDDDTITVRDRDTKGQIRLRIDEITSYLCSKF